MGSQHFILRSRYLFPCAFCAGLLGLFVLPFLFPPSYPVPGQSYVVGYNNRVAAVFIALISVVVAVLSLRATKAITNFSSERPVSNWWVSSVMLLLLGYVGTLAWLAFAAPGYGVEDFYILPQVEKYFYYRRHLYSEIEFCYGQLLFYPPIWIYWVLRPFHVTIRAAYYISVLLQHGIGLLMLAFIVNRLPMKTGLRAASFVSIALISFNPFLGPNYTLTRYLLPVFTFLLFSRIRKPLIAANVAVFVTTLQWLDSAELGIAFLSGLVAYSCYQAWRQSSWKWLATMAGGGIGTALYLTFTDHSFLSTLQHFSEGAGNQIIPISILPFTFLVAAVWLAPRLAAAHVAKNTDDSGLLVGLYALGLALLPAALGGSDYVHVLGNGLTLFLLSMVAVSELHWSVSWLWAAVVLVSYFVLPPASAIEERFRFRPDLACIEDRGIPISRWFPARLGAKLRRFENKWGCDEPPLDLSALHAVIGSESFEAPFHLPTITEEALFHDPQFLPSFWSGTIDLWDAGAQRQKVDELRKVDWAVLPGKPTPDPARVNYNPRFSLKTHYHAKHPMLINDIVCDEINRNWELVGYVSNYALYHRLR